MSSDLRNSIRLWMGALLVFGLFWGGLHFKWFDGLSKTWIGDIGVGLGAVNLARLFWGLWQRRAANPNNPNGS